MHEWVHSTPPDCNILQDSYSPVNWPILTLWGDGLTFIGLFNGNSSMSTICPQITPRGIQRKTLKAFPALIFDMTEPCCLRVCPFLLPAIQGHNNALAFLQDHLDNSYMFSILGFFWQECWRVFVCSVKGNKEVRGWHWLPNEVYCCSHCVVNISLAAVSI